MRARLRRLARRVRAAAPFVPGSAVVLVYHRATDLAVDPWGLAVSPGHLAEHLELLHRHARPTSAAGLADLLEAGSVPRGTVVVTFDDGYADLATTVRPALDRADVPATMFVVSDAVDDAGEFWWDALERVFLTGAPLPGRLELRIDGTERSWSVPATSELPAGGAVDHASWRAWHPPPTERHRIYRETWEALRVVEPASRDQLVAGILAWAGIAVTARASHRTVTTAELAELASDLLIEIGGHTRTHASLGALSPAGQLAEMVDGRDRLRDRIGRPVPSLAYPFGRDPDVTAATVALAREAGFRIAFTTHQGSASTRSNLLALPRVYVGDVDGDGFARMLLNETGLRVG